MATQIRNGTTSFFPLPQEYGGHPLAPNHSIVVNDTKANVITALGGIHPPGIDIDIAADTDADLVHKTSGAGSLILARIASTANLSSISGLSAIDGVTPVAGDTILLKNQSTASQNGLYAAASGAWSPVLDSAGNKVSKAGALVSVSEGSVAAGKVYALGSDLTTWSVQATSGISAANLASNATNLGASLVGIEDALGLIAGTTVEAALAELVKYEAVNLADPGGANVAIPVTRSAYVGMTCAGTETNTLAVPTFIGQRLILNLDTATSGSRAVTSAQAINQAGNTIMTFAQARDCVVLTAIKVGGALRWQVASNDGVALS